MARAATETQKAGLSGLEFGLAIPGTVGGAVWANAGAHENDVAAVVDWADVLPADGTDPNRHHRPALSYRDSGSRPAGDVVLAPSRPADAATIAGASTRSGSGAGSTSRLGSPRPAAFRNLPGDPRVG
jgi:hypothetical protein